MTSETATKNNLTNKDDKSFIRPKLLKLTDVQLPIRNRKKSRYKVRVYT